ncbi:hypothetical protein [Streptomyces sp. NBC_01465]|uniref:hypothetical protein n=1 Tax=Streptomyces sp. NBC_01465 TaxID=2903878 RepID=UPI002E32C173|nr:hypothetical protein [Streptomyces sp. NBC_01465]
MLANGLSVTAVLLSLLNLVLLLGVIRRLRDQSAAPAPHHADSPLPPGSLVDLPRLPTLIAFFAPGCAPCDDLLGPFAEAARRHPGGSGRVAAVLVGEVDAPRYEQALSGVSALIPQEDSDLWTKTFRVRGFPQVYALSPEGVVLWGASSVNELAHRTAR